MNIPTQAKTGLEWATPSTLVLRAQHDQRNASIAT